jgi:cell division protein FtsQ
MDRRGRLCGTLKFRQAPEDFAPPPSRLAFFVHRVAARTGRWRALRGIEIIFVTVLLAATALYGAIRGGHADAILDSVHDIADALAQRVGFQSANVSIEGAARLSRADVLRIAGITESSTLFLIDAETTRARLLRNSWVADATVAKLYPDRLEIAIVEKKPFAVWQSRGNFFVIAKDGTIIDQLTRDRVRDGGLPIVVGEGAERQAEDFLLLLDRFPAVRAEVVAAVLVAGRRWNLRLKNGTDVRLPEEDADVALMRLVALDREKHILSRDVVAIDMRFADRVVVRLSDEAAAARDAAIKARPPKRKGADT